MRRAEVPQFAHGLASVGLAAGSAGAPKSALLRRGWPGLLLTLAYAPDVGEWLLNFVVETPHGALCSIPVTVIGCALLALTLRLAFGETSAVVHGAALAALASHTLLDALSGGIPIGWPFSEATVGADPLALDDAPFRARILLEIQYFAPLLSAGLAWAIVARRRSAESLAAAVLLAGSVAMAWTGPAGASAATLAALAALWAVRVRLRDWIPTWQAVAAALPVLALVGVQLNGWAQVQLGMLADGRGDHEAAIQCYRRAAWLRPVGLQGVNHYRAGRSYLAMGRPELAETEFRAGMREQAGGTLFLDGLVHLHLYRDDPRYYKPHEALRLAQIVHARATKAYYKAYAADLVKLAEEAIRTSDRP